MKYTAIKNKYQEKFTELSDEVGLFWAFSEQQFAEGREKNPIKEGEKYTSIGMGGYLPKKNVQRFIDRQKELDKWQKQEIKKAKATEVILYELGNYECFYTGDIQDALEVLEPLGYTVEQVKEVYHANREFALN